ncbi:MAG TPA: peptidylprolyl isomerase [Phaeodactylibacter sp.]|nr:peptidylprolyl isomerase [Phaeodactylibacter sp.]
MVRIKTPYGDMLVELYDETPKHRDNFLSLVEKGYYNGLLFHRVMRNFMIQGGDPDSRNASKGQMLGSGGPGYTIPAEFNPNLVHIKGAVAAARRGDQVNPQRASSGSQFYIVQGKTFTDAELDQIERDNHIKYTPEQREAYKTIGGTPFLDGQYTVFGKVTEGLDVIDQITAQPTDRANRPLEDIEMEIEVVD